MSRLLRASILLLALASCGGGNFSAPRNLDDACAIMAQRPTYWKACLLYTSIQPWRRFRNKTVARVIGEFGRFGLDVRALGAKRVHRGLIEVGKDVQHQDRGCSLTVWRVFYQLDAMVGASNRAVSYTHLLHEPKSIIRGASLPGEKTGPVLGEINTVPSDRPVTHGGNVQ